MEESDIEILQKEETLENTKNNNINNDWQTIKKNMSINLKLKEIKMNNLINDGRIYQIKIRLQNQYYALSNFSNVCTINTMPIPIIDSEILNNAQKQQINQWLKHKKVKKYELLFRASKDGFAAHTFHAKCDNQGIVFLFFYFFYFFYLFILVLI